jgi:hypothetical protein
MTTTVSMVIGLLGAILSQSPAHPESATDSSAALPTPLSRRDTSDGHKTVEPHPGKSAPKGPIAGTSGNPLCGALTNTKLHWDPKLGPLHISGSVVVGPDKSMVLEAGTLVLASAGSSCKDSTGSRLGTTLLVAGGSLMVHGKPGHPVVFRPAIATKGFGWDGIRAEKAGEETVDLAWIEVRQAQTGISFVAGSGRLSHGVVEDCGIGIATLAGAAPRITHSVVSRSLVADAVSERSAPLFRSCMFLDGKGDGLRFQGTGLARVELSCFWGHRGSDVVRGPEGLGGWKGDSVPDRYGNRSVDPLLRGSESESIALAKFRQDMAGRSWWKRRRLPDVPNGSGPWALSPLSPLLGAGERGRCGLAEGARCDIGLWGGP